MDPFIIILNATGGFKPSSIARVPARSPQTFIHDVALMPIPNRSESIVLTITLCTSCLFVLLDIL